MPSMSTVQAPHCPRPQPNFGAVEPEVVAQHIEERRVGLGRHRAAHPVDLQARWPWAAPLKCLRLCAV